MASTADLTGPYGGKKRTTRGSSIEFLTDTFQVFRARVTFNNVSEIIESAFVLLILALLHSSEAPFFTPSCNPL